MTEEKRTIEDLVKGSLVVILKKDGRSNKYPVESSLVMTKNYRKLSVMTAKTSEERSYL